MSEGGGSITSHVRLKEQWNILKEETCKKRDFEQFGPSNVIISFICDEAFVVEGFEAADYTF